MIRWRIVPQADDKGLVCPGPGLLVTTGDGIAVAVTAEELQAAAAETHAFCCVPGPAVFQKLIAALSRPADGAAE